MKFYPESCVPVAAVSGFLLVAIGVAYWFVISFFWGDIGIPGAVFPDALGWHRTFLGGELSEDHAQNPAGRSSRFFKAIYDIHPLLHNVGNWILLGVAAFLTVRASWAVGGRSGAQFAGFVMAMNPLMWVIAIGPTKEPFSFLAASAVALFAARPGLGTCLFAFAVALVLAMVRLEQAAILIVSLPLMILVRRVSQPRAAILAICCFAMAFAIQLFSIGRAVFGEKLRVMSPQLGLPIYHAPLGPDSIGAIGLRMGADGWMSTQWNVIAFAYRMAANPLGCLWRMGVWTEDGRLSVLGIGFAVTGFLSVSGLAALLLRFRRSDDRFASVVAVPMVLLWISASAVPFTQPRYMFTMLPVGLVVLAGLDRKVRSRVLLVMLAIGIAGRIGFFLSGHGVPPESVVRIDRTPFLLGPPAAEGR